MPLPDPCFVALSVADNVPEQLGVAYLLQVTTPTEPETVVEIVAAFTASLLAANPAGDIFHAGAILSCCCGGIVGLARGDVASLQLGTFFLPRRPPMLRFPSIAHTGVRI